MKDWSLKSDQNLLDSKNFCMLPWVHMHFWPGGEVFPCCLSDSSMPVGQFGRNSSIREIWNSEGMRKLRVNMLRDTPSPECSRCYKLEEYGTYTLRKMSLENFKRFMPRVRTTESDGTVEELAFAYLDIRFSNVCNFRCRSCGPRLSSSWYEDQVKGHGKPPHPKVIQIEPSEKFWSELEPLLEGVDECYFAGGEPFLSEEHYRVLDYWLARGKTDVRITYTTNFSQLNYKKQRIVDYWKRFKNIRVSASLDDSGKRGEYLRKGTDWAQIVANRREMIQECPGVFFEITPTISAFNVSHFPVFHREWIERGLIEPDHVRINLLTFPDSMSVQILPREMKERIAENYRSVMAELIQSEKSAGRPFENIRTGYQSVIDFMLKEDKVGQIPAFLATARKIDVIRNEKLTEAFPELVELERMQGVLR